MKIEHRSPDLLVLTDLGAPIRAVGGFMVAFGVVWIYAGSRNNALNITSLFIGSLCAVGGILLIALPARVTAAFDKQSKIFILTRRTLRGTTQDTVELPKIAEVEAEQSPSSGANPTWRVTVVLQNGTRLPLTSYYSNSRTHEAAAAAAREFLGLAPPPPAAAPPPLKLQLKALFGGTPQQLPYRRRAPRVVAVLFASLFICIGGFFFYMEWHALSTSRPTPAVILSTRVELHRSSGRNSSVTYKPIVAYSYVVDGRPYTGTRVTPLNESRSGNWAYDLLARYQVGATVTAWYDPDHPDHAFLLHEWSFLPFLFVFFPAVLILVVTLISRRTRSIPPPVAPPNSDSRIAESRG